MNLPKKYIITITLIISIALSPIGLAAPAPLSVHFIDVGQANSIMVHIPRNHFMLIDTDNNAGAATVTGYLSKVPLRVFGYFFPG
jgi:competence protein ComEC